MARQCRVLLKSVVITMAGLRSDAISAVCGGEQSTVRVLWGRQKEEFDECERIVYSAQQALARVFR